MSTETDEVVDTTKNILDFCLECINDLPEKYEIKDWHKQRDKIITELKVTSKDAHVLLSKTQSYLNHTNKINADTKTLNQLRAEKKSIADFIRFY